MNISANVDNLTWIIKEDAQMIRHHEMQKNHIPGILEGKVNGKQGQRKARSMESKVNGRQSRWETYELDR